MIQDYLRPKKTFGEEFSYKTYSFRTCKAIMCKIDGLKDLRIEETILLRATYTEDSV